MNETAAPILKPAEPVFPARHGLTAKDVFGLILRSVALWLTIWGAWNTIAGLKYLPSSLGVEATPDLVSHTVTYFIFGLSALVAGILVLRFANAILRYTYRAEGGSANSRRRSH